MQREATCAAVRPDGADARQRLAEVSVDGRPTHRVDTLQLARRADVHPLYTRRHTHTQIYTRCTHGLHRDTHGVPIHTGTHGVNRDTPDDNRNAIDALSRTFPKCHPNRRFEQNIYKIDESKS